MFNSEVDFCWNQLQREVVDSGLWTFQAHTSAKCQPPGSVQKEWEEILWLIIYKRSDCVISYSLSVLTIYKKQALVPPTKENETQTGYETSLLGRIFDGWFLWRVRDALERAALTPGV